jgi:hypothetical protein
MAVPPRNLGDLLGTNWTESVLLFPEGEQPAFPLESRCYVNVETLFKVAFPCRIIGIGLCPDFHVSDDRHAIRVGQVPWVLVHHSREDPVVSSDGGEVFLHHPGLGFPGVSSPGPSSDSLIDHFIDGTEDVLAHDMPVVVDPSSNDWVEFHYQFSGRDGFIGLHNPPDLLKECFHILLGWGDQQFVPLSRLVLAYLLTQEIEPILDMRDAGLFLREGQTSFAQKRFDDRFDFLFEELS